LILKRQSAFSRNPTNAFGKRSLASLDSCEPFAGLRWARERSDHLGGVEVEQVRVELCPGARVEWDGVTGVARWLRLYG
jgi:hypothetical protein